MVVFSHVVEQGSFSAAARQLKLTRTVVSYHMKKLEASVGVKLLHRSTRSLSLTEAGKAFYESSRLIVEQAIAAQQKMEHFRSEPEGRLSVTCPVNMGLQLVVPALKAFKAQFPKIELDILLSDEVVNLIQSGTDLAIRGAPLVDSNLHARKLSSLGTQLYAAPSYLNQHGRPTQPTDLAEHQWVIYQLGAPYINLTKGSRSFKVKVSGDISTNNAAARTAFVEGGYGIARIPIYDAQPKVAQGLLEPVMADYKLADIDVYGVYPPGSTGAKKVRLLLDFLVHYFQNQSNLAGQQSSAH
ncbi:LysR substrate-binding domain-containing protein [Shewanella waksmanii]|uniref:LysR family transcriptional regulator n=1 Tax=Shewanella waksmanii TaxID=213783 RepID=UPI00373621AE